MIERTERDFAAVASIRYGCEVRVRIEVMNDVVWHAIEVERGPLSHASDRVTTVRRGKGGFWTGDEFARLTPEGRVEELVGTCDHLLETDRHVHAGIAEIVAGLPDECAERLRDLRLRKVWGDNSYFQLDCAWTGHGDDLRIARQVLSLKIRHGEIHTLVRDALVRAAARDVRRESLVGRGLLADPPLAALLKTEGRTLDEFVEAARAHGLAESRSSEKPSPGPMEFAGRRMSIAFRDGAVRSEFALSDRVRWAKGCVTVRGIDIAEALLGGMRGRRLREVVDHPWLDGLVVAAASTTRSAKGAPVTTIMTREASRTNDGLPSDKRMAA